jgi:hypothetical protein
MRITFYINPRLTPHQSRLTTLILKIDEYNTTVAYSARLTDYVLLKDAEIINLSKPTNIIQK